MIRVDDESDPPEAVGRVLTSPPDAEVTVSGRRYLYFGGTSYLGLHARPEVIAAGVAAFQRYGLHTATSRSGFGESPPLLDAEAAAARFLGADAAFHSATGWASASILVAGIADAVDVVFLDERSHYAVREAMRGIGQAQHTFAHRDPDSLATQIQRHALPGARVLVATDGVFPITGAIAPLDDYVAVLAGRRGATLLVDDAHGLGVLGATGRGTAEHCGLAERAFAGAPAADGVRILVGGTLSKALGGYGGVIAGPVGQVDLARRASHWYEGASAPPAPVTASSAAALAIASAEPELRDRLGRNVARVRNGLKALGFDVPTGLPTPAVGFVAGDAENMRDLAAALRRQGILLPWFPSYSGLGLDGALRVAVFATHTDAQIDRLLTALRELA